MAKSWTLFPCRAAIRCWDWRWPSERPNSRITECTLAFSSATRARPRWRHSTFWWRCRAPSKRWAIFWISEELRQSSASWPRSSSSWQSLPPWVTRLHSLAKGEKNHVRKVLPNSRWVAIIPTRSSLARITQIGFHRHHRQCRERERQQVHLQSGNRRENLSSPHVKNANQILNLNTTVPLNSPCFDVTWNDVISDNLFDFAPFQFSLKIRLPFFYLIWMDVRFLCCIFNFHCHFLNIVFHLLKFSRRVFGFSLVRFWYLFIQSHQIFFLNGVKIFLDQSRLAGSRRFGSVLVRYWRPIITGLGAGVTDIKSGNKK